jgi:hypothetical protein
MAKPIFLVKIPDGVEMGIIVRVQEKLSNELPDYHVLMVAESGVSDISFQAFYDKDLIEKDFETFKQEVRRMINES